MVTHLPVIRMQINGTVEGALPTGPFEREGGGWSDECSILG